MVKTMLMVGVVAAAVAMAAAGLASAFTAPNTHHRRAQTVQPTKMMTMMMIPAANIDAMPATFEQAPVLASLQQQRSSVSISSSSSPMLQAGVGNYLSSAQAAGGDVVDSMTSNSFLLSLKERPPPPTPEELAAKKRNFNLWFWGGGFVAPFLATFYYFGFKFWEK